MSGGSEVIGVAELHRRLKSAVHAVANREWVEGEVAGLKQAASGHAYFQLKDERQDAVVDCVMYKFYAARARRFLADGARVQLRGNATIYAPRGRLQFVAESLRPGGRGALLEALEQLKAKLKSEGLFEPERKRPLPSEPRVVGVVTSRSGAAFTDIRTVALRRANIKLVLAAAVVQGESAPRSLIAALDKLERYPGLDVVIIGRGGGSGEDLMAFNDERVVRRVAKIRVPVVSAVGHEIDTSLTDYVADRRAATPSEAAELVVPDKLFRVRAMRDQERHLVRAMRSRLLEAHSQLGRLQGALGDPRFYLAEQQQRLDELAVELERNIRAQLRVRRQLSDRLQRRVLSQHPSVVLTRARASLAPLSSRLPSAMHSRLGRHQALLNERRSSLEALSPLAVLGRGYAIVSTADGRVVTDAETLHSKDIVHLRLRRGQVFAEVTKSDPPEVDA